ncbi:MAG TPA: hypothetical protein DEG88_10565 [Propionibacteriaceae bacterium]|nr:hypothetical protein [Propionibacteriaceae bacterium]HBY23686.1 hypothetical protein [Propionibacteriaceae bacterium]
MPVKVLLGCVVGLLIGLLAWGGYRMLTTKQVAPAPSATSSATSSAASSAQAAAAAAGIVAPSGPCTAAKGADGRLSDGYVTLPSPTGWNGLGHPPWTTCGVSVWAEGKTAGTWKALLVQGVVGNPAKNIVGVRDSLWAYLPGHYLDMSVTKMGAQKVGQAVVQGAKAASASGLVTFADGKEANVVLLVIERLDGNLSVVFSVLETDDATNASALSASFGQMKIGG